MPSLFPASSSVFRNWNTPVWLTLAATVLLSLACVAWASCHGVH